MSSFPHNCFLPSTGRHPFSLVKSFVTLASCLWIFAVDWGSEELFMSSKLTFTLCKSSVLWNKSKLLSQNLSSPLNLLSHPCFYMFMCMYVFLSICFLVYTTAVSHQHTMLYICDVLRLGWKESSSVDIVVHIVGRPSTSWS